MWQTVSEIWHWLVVAASLVAAVGAGLHVVTRKRDEKAAVAWLGFIVFLPLIGALTYIVFGINRIHGRAETKGRRHPPEPEGLAREQNLGRGLPAVPLPELEQFVSRVVKAPLLFGNRFEVYERGAAFKAMLGAMAEARRSVTLLTYIFGNDALGRRFQEALVAAQGRGLQVRVLIDAVGDRYSQPSMFRRLRAAGVRTAVFNPTTIPRSVTYANLRNHRKLMVLDGERAFTGGMNLRHGHAIEESPRYPVQDVHFSVRGPVVGSLQRVFANDWAFTTGEWLDEATFFHEFGNVAPDVAPDVADGCAARAIDDGPAETLGHLRWTLLGALACAQQRVRIATPYFLPDEGLLTALAMAARRGVEVDILLPEQGNLKLVQWASTALWWQVLEGGSRIFLTPPPFDHSKLMVVDGLWSLIGSANWDPRSLRLNFELNVEVYSGAFAQRIDAVLDRKQAAARAVSLVDLVTRPRWIRLRDGLARLASPYL